MYDTARSRTDAVVNTIRAGVARGADWQQVTIATVNTNGTCDVLAADGSTIPHVRRAAGYTSPAAGDVVLMHRSQSGERYLAAIAPADGTDSWQTLPMASGYVTHFTVCQMVRIGLRVQLRGNFGPTSGALASGTGNTQFAALPAGWRPLNTQYACLVGMNGNTARLAAQPTGELQYTLTQPPPSTVPTWLDLSHATISLD